MHHFIYPSKDTYVTNRTNYDEKNFGIDELLLVGTSNTLIRNLSPTKTYSYTDVIFNTQVVTYFTGKFTGSFSGHVDYADGTLSGSSLTFSASYFSGSIDGSPVEGSGSFGDPASGSLVDGIISGSVIATYSTGLFTGIVTGSSGCLTGTGSGVDVRNEQNWVTDSMKFVDRAFLQFDLNAISASIAEGGIADPHFYLRVKVCREYELPITYKIYALPISQSWNMGNGYYSDGGSDRGVSWQYRDNKAGTSWFSQSIESPRPAIDFINDPSLATASFAYGGGTFYTSSICSQSFNYESSDINMDVTPMVLSWLSGSFPNEGLMLIQSDELESTGSGFTLSFFSRDTNTIYSPVLDVAWDDITLSGGFATGSLTTSSVVITTITSGITASIQSGSTFTIAGGISGSFSSSAVLTFTENYLPVEYLFNGEWTSFTGSYTGTISGSIENVFGTVSGSNLIFEAAYFSGFIDAAPVTTSGSVSGSAVTGIVTGSIIAPTEFGVFSGYITASNVYLNGTGLVDTLTDLSASGVVSGTGLGGNILGLPIFGQISASVSISASTITGPCGNSFDAQSATASFYTGIWSGSSFTAYYVDHKFENAFLTGSWTPESLYGARVYIGIPSGIDPYAYATVVGTYVSGRALGTYELSGSDSASFSGQFIDGNLIGGIINLQLSGSVYTSSFSYTSSVEFTSSVLNSLDTARPFTVTLSHVQPTYKAGDIVKLNVFARKQYPLKGFTKTTQQEQYLVPEYLPTSSYYALKDNETGEILMNFDNYTQIGCMYPEGNYFLIDTTSLPQERYYRVLIRVDDGQSVYTIDTGKAFKVTR